MDGKIQPLIFDAARIFPVRLNLDPIKYLLNYEIRRAMLVNIIGNTAMFIPIGVIWLAVFPNLNTHRKVISAGVGFSLSIEIMQLPFFDRVSDIDDLLLNSLGYLIVYAIFLLISRIFVFLKKQK